MVDRITVPQRCLYPPPSNLYRCHFMWHKGPCGVIRLRILQRGDYPVLRGPAQCKTTRVLIKGRRVEVREGDVSKKAGPGRDQKMPNADFEEGGRAVSQGNQPASRSCKGEETNSSLEPLEGVRFCRHRDFSSTRSTFALLTSRTIR